MIFELATTSAMTAVTDTGICFNELYFSSLDQCQNAGNIMLGGYVWVWMTVVPLGVYFSAQMLVSNAMDCYNFVAAWNMISRTQRMDLEILHYHKNARIQRRTQMEKALDTRPYGDVFFPKESNCPICLQAFQRSDLVTCSTKSRKRDHCGHLFHKECLEIWLQKHPSCPCCRYELLPLLNLPPHPILSSQ